MQAYKKEVAIITTNENGTTYAETKEDVQQLFKKLSILQRGRPEEAMVDYQKAIGGGVMNVSVEHLGDIVHRITHHAVHNTFYPDIAQEKAEIVIKKLTSNIDFLKEHKRSVVSNAEFYGHDPDVMLAKASEMLKVYGQAHKNLPSYNPVQYWCKIACVALGDQNIPLCIKYTEMINALALNTDKFLEMASTVYRDSNNKIVTYEEYLENDVALNNVASDFTL